MSSAHAASQWRLEPSFSKHISTRRREGKAIGTTFGDCRHMGGVYLNGRPLQEGVKSRQTWPRRRFQVEKGAGILCTAFSVTTFPNSVEMSLHSQSPCA